MNEDHIDLLIKGALGIALIVIFISGFRACQKDDFEQRFRMEQLKSQPSQTNSEGK